MLSLLRWQIWALSFLFWTIYAVLDSIGSVAILRAYGDKYFLHNVIVWNFAEAYIWVLFTPLIYAVAVHFPLSGELWKKSLAIQIPLGLAFATVGAWLLIHMNMLLGTADLSSPFRARLLALMLQDLPRYFVTMGVAQVVVYYATVRKQEMESANLETKLAQAQLEVLRAQMEPHFLFNSLNAIARLTRKDPKLAERMTFQLAAFLRMSLECAGSPEVPLSQELEFLQNYLAIQKTRFGDRLTIRVNVDRDLLSTPVPSLILQPLAENAIRHGIARSAKPGHLEVTAFAENGFLKIQVSDNGAGIDSRDDDGRDGIGLRNTRARLGQMYGNQQELRLEDNPGGGCRVTITIQLVNQPRLEHLSTATTPAKLPVH
jgi:two-component system LytT family sensor kinase